MNPRSIPLLCYGMASALLLLFAFTVSAQVAIATSLPGCLDMGIEKAGISCGGGTTEFGLSGSHFVVRNVDGKTCCNIGGDGQTYFEFPSINIAGFSDVAISLAFAASNTTYEDIPGGPHFGCSGNVGIDNGHDQILFSYSLDGGPFTYSQYVHGTTANDFTGTWQQGNITGKTLKIRVWASNKAAAEIFTFSNLLVSGFPESVSAGPDRSVCGTVPVTLSGSGSGSWSGGNGSFGNPASPTTSYTPAANEIGNTVVLTFRGTQPAALCGPSVAPSEDQVTVAIQAPPALTAPGDQSVCNSFTLPAITGTGLTNAAYFTGPNRSGGRLAAGNSVDYSTRLYLHDGIPGCSDEKSFVVEVIPTPDIAPFSPVYACDKYVLPDIKGNRLTGAQRYYTGPGGSGQSFLPGNTLNSTMDLYAYDNINGCYDEEPIAISIRNNPQLDPIPPFTSCGFFVLPPIRGSNLSGGQAYFTGPGGSGQRRTAGDTLFTSVLLYAFDSKDDCVAEDTFQVTILTAPRFNPLPDSIYACLRYVLPEIAGSFLSGKQAYFTGPGGSGIKLPVGQILLDPTRLFIFDSIGACAAERSFVVLPVKPVQLDSIPDILACGSYPLPTITGLQLAGNEAYYTGPGGTGLRYLAGQILTAGNTLYAYGGRAAGCTATRRFKLTVTEGPQPEISPSAINLCQGDRSGALRLNIRKGIPPYQVKWWDGVRDSLSRSGLSGGTYSVTVTDSSNCIATASIDLKDPPEINLSYTQVQPVGKINGEDGIAAVVISGGSGRYNLKISGPIGISQNGLLPGRYLYNRLKPGQYTVAVQDSTGCIKTCTFIISEPVCALQLSLEKSNPRCASSGDGTIAVRLAGGTGPVQYEWGNPLLNGKAHLVSLRAGNYYLTVTDSVGCTTTAATILLDPPRLSLECAPGVSVTTVKGRDGKAQIRLSGGTPGYTLSWQGPLSGSLLRKDPGDSILISGLPSGNYRLLAKDSIGCSDSCIVAINEPVCTLKATISLLREIACAGESNGVLLAVGSKGIPPYAYSWSGNNTGTATDTLTQLSPGSYAVTINDAIGCKDSTGFSLNSPPPLSAFCAVLSSERTRGGDEGRALLQYKGGTGAVQVNWPGAIPGKIEKSTPDSLLLTGLFAGLYKPEFKDQNGCKANCSFIIDSINCQVRASAAIINPTCFETGNGKIEVSVENAIAPYHFSWSADQRDSSRNTLSGIGSGTYRVTITDAQNCKDTLETVVAAPPPLSLNCEILSNVSEFGLNDGQVRLTAMGGTAPYRLIVRGKTEEEIQAPAPGQVLLKQRYAGKYDLAAVDANGCSDTCNILIVQPPCKISIALSATEPTCAGEANASISAIVTNGRKPFRYNWNLDRLDGNNGGNGLRAGNYALLVSDSVGCTATAQLQISDPPVVQVECLAPTPTRRVNGMDGTQTLKLEGGDPPYQLVLGGVKQGSYIVPNQGYFTIDSLPRGDYSLSITDSKGCIANSCSFRVEDPQCNLKVTLSGQEPTCTGLSNGSITTTLSNAVLPLQLNWNRSELNQILHPNNLTAGVYQLEVTDDRLCRDTATIELRDPPRLRFECAVLQHPQTVGGAEGIVQLLTTGGTGKRTLTWNGPGPVPQSIPDTLTLSGLPAGTYEAHLSDSNLCKETCSFTLPPIVCNLRVSVVPSPARCFAEASGSIRLSLSGARGNTLFRWSNGAVTADLRSVAAGPYAVTVTDAALCKDSASAFVYNTPALLLEAAALSRPSGTARADGRAHLHYGGGSPPYSISWSGPANGQFSREKAGKDTLGTLPAGIYVFTITDSVGCRSALTLSIDTFRCQLSASLRQQSIDCETAALTTSISGATGPLRFDWNKDEMDGIQNPAPVPAGFYLLNLSDSTGCSVQVSAQVSPSGPLEPTLEAVEGWCAGDPGSIIIESLKRGRKPYEIILNNGQAKPLAAFPLVLRNILPGDVRLRLRSSDGCSFDTILRINPVSKPLLELGPDQEIFPGDSIRLQPQIGFDPETWQWIPENGLDRPGALQVVARPKTTTTYLLKVTDSKGCPADDQVTVFVLDRPPIFFPTAFSPNGDGTNDFFTGFAGPLISSIENLSIFDPGGSLLFEGKQILPNFPPGGWDGRAKNGIPVAPGVYVFRALVRLYSGKIIPFSGEVSVVR